MTQAPPSMERAPEPARASVPAETSPSSFQSELHQEIGPAKKEHSTSRLINRDLYGWSGGSKIDFGPEAEGQKNDVAKRQPSGSERSDNTADGTQKQRDNAGRIISITFANSPDKRLNYTYSDSGELVGVERIDKSKGVELHLHKDLEQGTWSVKKDGVIHSMPGQVDVGAGGELAVQQKDGTWRVEDLQGKVITENRLASGARLQVNYEKLPIKISRTDGSELFCRYDQSGALEAVAERKNSAVTVWNRDENGRFKSISEEIREEVAVDKNGNLRFKSEDNSTHIVTGDGTQIVTKQGEKRSSSYDSEGRLANFTKADGSSRRFEYEGKSTVVTKFVEANSKGEAVATFERVGTNNWSIKGTRAAGNWQGDITTNVDGSWSILAEDDRSGQSTGLWRRVDAQENTSYFRKNSDGSTLILDANKGFSKLLRSDGSEVSWTSDGISPKINATSPNGENINFQFDAKARIWKSDTAGILASSAMPINARGELTYKTKDGVTHTAFTDGTIQNSGADGKSTKFDLEGNVLAISSGKFSRTFQRSGAEIVGYTDKVDGQPERKIDLSHETKVRTNSSGDLFHTDRFGKSYIETSDFARVETNHEGKPERITAANGSVRELGYSPIDGSLISITDKMKVGEKEISRTWETGGPDWNGTFAVIGEKDGKLTQRFARHDVKVDEFGNYSYLNQAGERVQSMVGDGARVSDNGWNSASIDEAHHNFLETMRDNLRDETRVARLETMMSGFEQRMQDTIERRVAAGEQHEQVRNQVEKRVSATYDHLARLAGSEDARALDKKDTRAILAETFMYHAWEPETVTQEGWGSCWLQSGYIPCGLGEHPDDMAKVLSDVSLKGSFTDRENRSYVFRQSDLGIYNTGTGLGWSIGNAPNTSAPSPVAHRLDATLATMDEGARYGGAGDVRRIRSGGFGQAEIMRRVTGDSLLRVDGYPNNARERALLAKSGGAQRDGGPHHVATWALRKEKDHWLLVRGNQYNDQSRGDRVVSVIRDLKSWIANGESAAISKRFGPQFGTDFKVIADNIKPTDYRPSNSTDRFDNHNERQFRIFGGRRRRANW